MADFDTAAWAAKRREAVAEREQAERARGAGKVTASENLAALGQDFSKMTPEQVIGYLKGTPG